MYADERVLVDIARMKKLQGKRETLTNFQTRCYKELDRMSAPEMYFRDKWPKAKYLEVMIDRASEALFWVKGEIGKINKHYPV